MPPFGVVLQVVFLQLVVVTCSRRVDGVLASGNFRVAIIGAGVGGSAAAHYIRNSLQQESFNGGVAIDVFERSDRLCGRLRSMTVDGQEYEVGAAVAHPKNKYMADLLEISGLQKLAAATGDFGLVPAAGKYISLGDASKSWSEDFHLLFRYGHYIVELDLILGYLFSEFSDVYELQAQTPPRTFATLHDFLQALPASANFTGLSGRGFSEFLKSEGLPGELINELVSATVQAVYNQDGDTITALSGMTSLARSANDRYWSVLGGNQRLCESLLTKANATVNLNQTVTHIRYNDESSLSVTVQLPGGLLAEEQYDFVVIAAPINMANISLEGFPTALPAFNPGVGQRTTSTLVKGDVNLTFFGLSESAPVPWVFAMPAGNGLPVSLIEQTPPVDGSATQGRPVWKVQSTDAVPEEFLNTVFPGNSAVVTHTFEFAYPHFAVPNALGPLQLSPRLIYNSGIEWASSAMEMSCISAKNSALLVAKEAAAAARARSASSHG